MIYSKGAGPHNGTDISGYPDGTTAGFVASFNDVSKTYQSLAIPTGAVSADRADAMGTFTLKLSSKGHEISCASTPLYNITVKLGITASVEMKEGCVSFEQCNN